MEYICTPLDYTAGLQHNPVENILIWMRLALLNDKALQSNIYQHIYVLQKINPDGQLRISSTDEATDMSYLLLEDLI